MAAIAKVFARMLSSHQTESETFKLLVIFCLTGLVATLLVANYAGGLNVAWPDQNF